MAGRRTHGRRPVGADVLTALVVDDSAGARSRVGTLLRMGGWEVHEAVGTEAALDVAVDVRPDLVITDFVLRGGNGAALLHRLRNEGCRARSVVVASQLTDQVREYAAAAGALACLAKPVAPRELLDVMQVLCGNSVGAGPLRAQPAPVRVEAERLDRAHSRYVSTLPMHLSAIRAGAQQDDPVAVASAAQILAGASSAAGESEVARVCTSIAAEADRGVLARAQLMQLVAISVSASGRRRPHAGDRTYQS